MQTVTIGTALALTLSSALAADAQTMAPAPGQSGAPMPAASGNMGAGHGAMSGESGTAVNFVLTENGKPGGKAGEVVIAQRGSDLVVTVKDPNATSTEPAMIYKGTCEQTSRKPAYKLSEVTNGSSQTTLKRKSLSELTSGQYALQVNGSPRMCADLNNAKPATGEQRGPVPMPSATK